VAETAERSSQWRLSADPGGTLVIAYYQAAPDDEPPAVACAPGRWLATHKSSMTRPFVRSGNQFSVAMLRNVNKNRCDPRMRLAPRACMKRFPTFVVLVAALSIAPAAFADSIYSAVLFNTVRSIQVSGSGAVDRYYEAGPWSDSLTGTADGSSATTSQDTQMSPDFLGGHGFAEAAITRDGPAYGAGGQADFSAFFTIGQQYTAQIDGELFAANGFAIARLDRVPDPSGPSDSKKVWSAFSGFPSYGTTQMTFDGTLLPGTYLFSMGSSSFANRDARIFTSAASFDGGLTLTPIEGTELPEPASLTLVGLGFLSVAARKWRTTTPARGHIPRGPGGAAAVTSAAHRA
jgi:hypothetical protein